MQRLLLWGYVEDAVLKHLLRDIVPQTPYYRFALALIHREAKKGARDCIPRRGSGQPP